MVGLATNDQLPQVGLLTDGFLIGFSVAMAMQVTGFPRGPLAGSEETQLGMEESQNEQIREQEQEQVGFVGALTHSG